MATFDIFCPYPLVEADPFNTHGYYTWYVYGNCTVPCPTLEYTPSEWSHLTTLLAACCLASLIMSFTSFVAHCVDFNKYYIQCMFIGGFLLNSIVTSIFFLVNQNNDVVCDGDSHFIKKGSLCIFQAVTFIFSFIWVECWSVLFVFDMYLHVTLRATAADIPMLRYKYTAIAVIFTLSMLVPPLLAGNIGFDPLANVSDINAM